MVLSIDEVVRIFIWLLAVGGIFGLMFFLTFYISRQFPDVEPWMRIVRVALVILAVFVAIGFLLALIGHPIIRIA
jgi:hypothetical protein